MQIFDFLRFCEVRIVTTAVMSCSFCKVLFFSRPDSSGLLQTVASAGWGHSYFI